MLLGGAGTVNCQPRRDGVQDICLCMHPTTVRYSWITRLVVGGLDLFVLLSGGALSFVSLLGMRESWYWEMPPVPGPFCSW
jgi:hypothetical protein